MNRHWLFDDNDVLGVEGAIIDWEDARFFTLTYKGTAFNGEILADNSEENQLIIKINHRVFNIRKKGPLDNLIKALGLDKPKIKQLKELPAPMPGRILKIFVNIGDSLQPGDEILSLEAMKMENILKAEGTGTVKTILVNSNQVVEKGAVLIEFN